MRLHAAALASLAVSSTALAQDSLEDLGADRIIDSELSADGSAALLMRNLAGGPVLERWRRDQGIERLVTPDGRAPFMPFRLSGDGSVAIGTGVALDGRIVCYRFDAAGNRAEIAVPGADETQGDFLDASGEIVVGRYLVLPDQRGFFVWTAASGAVDVTPQTLPAATDYLSTPGVSNDGSAFLGTSTDSVGNLYQFIWRRGVGATEFVTPQPGRYVATDLSGNGEVIVGTVLDTGGDPEALFAWTEAGGFEVESFPIAVPRRVGVSDDGRIVHGSIEFPWWDFRGGLFTWTRPQGISVTVVNERVEVDDVSEDAAVLVGRLGADGLRSYRWTEAGGFEVAPVRTSGDLFSWLAQVSSDGSVALLHPAELFMNRRTVVWRKDDSLGQSICGPSVPHSGGTSASMELRGTNQIGTGPLVLRAEALPAQTFGLFIASTQSGFVPGAGQSQGVLCLGGHIGRFAGPGQVQSSGSAGAFQLEVAVDALPRPNGPTAPLVGERWFFQAWFRDPAGATSNFTDAATVRFF